MTAHDVVNSCPFIFELVAFYYPKGSRIRRQAVGERATYRTSADDDEVVVLGRHRPRLAYGPCRQAARANVLGLAPVATANAGRASMAFIQRESSANAGFSIGKPRQRLTIGAKQ
jgi:hypothetical protein